MCCHCSNFYPLKWRDFSLCCLYEIVSFVWVWVLDSWRWYWRLWWSGLLGVYFWWVYFFSCLLPNLIVSPSLSPPFLAVVGVFVPCPYLWLFSSRVAQWWLVTEVLPFLLPDASPVACCLTSSLFIGTSEVASGISSGMSNRILLVRWYQIGDNCGGGMRNWCFCRLLASSFLFLLLGCFWDFSVSCPWVSGGLCGGLCSGGVSGSLVVKLGWVVVAYGGCIDCVGCGVDQVSLDGAFSCWWSLFFL